MNVLNTFMNENGQDSDISSKLNSKNEIIEHIKSKNENESNNCLNGLDPCLQNYPDSQTNIKTSNDNHKYEPFQNINLSQNINNDGSLGHREDNTTGIGDREIFGNGFDGSSAMPPPLILVSENMASHSLISDDSVSDISTESGSSDLKKPDDTIKSVVETGEISASNSWHQIEQQKHEIIDLQNIIEKLQNERTHLEIQASHSVCRSQIEQMQREIELFKQEQDLEKRTQVTLKLENESLKKQYETANKERETIVMRYAVSEMEVINQRKELENMEKKCKEFVKEKEGLSSKLKSTMIEKARISQLLDNKCSEHANTQKDVEKLKEELNSKDIKIKWTQNKLKTETESLKESQVQVEKLSLKIQEAKEEVEKAKKDAELAIKQFQCSQENKAYVLEQQLKEQQAQLILERHSLGDKENSNKIMSQEVEALHSKQLLLIDENNALKLKVASLEKERNEQMDTIGRLKESVDKSSQEVNVLQEKTATMDNLTLKLQQEHERISSLQSQVAQLKTANEDLVNDMAGCREREADMLEFTQKVTAKNVRLQSEYSCIEAKARQLECEEEPLQQRVNELLKKVEELQKELSKEKLDRNEEKKLVARHLAEKTAKVESLNRELEDLKGENQVMRTKHATAIRELNREVAQFRRRLDQPESSSGSDSLCQGSRTSSCTSLPDSAPTTLPSARLQTEPDKQTMVDRILRLQRENVRLREKMDFLEEHSKQLVAELQKKTRVIQSYMVREEAGTLSSGFMDFNKAELSKHGGIMASVYTNKPVDDSMTLELSLEINRKLQAVLEDTLLKNITLKENIDTLGDEIRRLSNKT